MADGLNIRAGIDTENVKGLLLINGGGAVALLAFLPHIIDKPNYSPLTLAVLWGMLLFQIGLLFAIIHNRLRRKCSLIYERYHYKPPSGKVLGIKLDEPCVCKTSIIFMWLSVAAFCGAGLTVFIGGYTSLANQKTAKQTIKEVQHPKSKSPPVSLPERAKPAKGVIQ